MTVHAFSGAMVGRVWRMGEHIEVPEDSTVLTPNVAHRCSVCGQNFSYRYDGVYRASMLRPIDGICNRCFPAWFQRWEALHDWR